MESVCEGSVVLIKLSLTFKLWCFHLEFKEKFMRRARRAAREYYRCHY